MNLKEELAQKSDEKLVNEAKKLAEIMKPKLIESASEGYQSLKINLQNYPDYIEPYLQFIGVERFCSVLSSQLDKISVCYTQEPRYLQAFGEKALVGHTPYLIFDWRVRNEF